MARALSTRYQVLPASRLHVAASGQPVAESLRVEVGRRVMHVLVASAILASAHQLVVDATGAPARRSAASVAVVALALLVDHVHPVEIVLGQIHVLSRLVLHVQRQLFYLVAIFVIDTASRDAAWVNQLALRLPSRLAVIVSGERYLRVTLVGRDLVVVHRVHVLRILAVHVLLLPLSGLDHSGALDLCLLPRARPPACDALAVRCIAHPVVAAASWIRVEVVSGAREGRKDVRLVHAREDGASAWLPNCSLGLQILILLALLLLLDVWTVTAMSLRALVDFILNGRPESILRPVLLLARQDALVEELGILLASIEGVVPYELIICASLRAAVAPLLAILAAAWRVPDACAKIDCIVVDCLKLIIFVDGLVVDVVLVVANWIALVEVSHLADAVPVLVVVGAASIEIVQGDAVRSTVFRIESAVPLWQPKIEALVEVARRADLAAPVQAFHFQMPFLHSVLLVCDATFVLAAIDHSSIVITATVLKVLRLVH